MSVGGDFVELFKGKILSFRAGGELFQAKVDGIGAEVERGEGGVQAAGGGQQLDGTRRRLRRRQRHRQRHLRLGAIVCTLGGVRLRGGLRGARHGAEGRQAFPAGAGGWFRDQGEREFF